MKLVEYADREMMAMNLAQKLAGDLNTALHRSDRVLFAVPGGTTPGPVFDDLCAADLDWAAVDLILTDERWVPEDDPRSNTRLVRDRLLVERAAAARLVPMVTADATPEEAIAKLTEEIAPRLPVDVLLLGMGTDGHVASLFPGAEGLEAALADDAPLLATISAPGVPEPRLTMTVPVLAGALAKHLVITGEEKRAMLDASVKRDPREAPVAAVMDGMTVHWAP